MPTPSQLLLQWWAFLLQGPPPYSPDPSFPSTLALLGTRFYTLTGAALCLFCSVLLFLRHTLAALSPAFARADAKTQAAALAWASASLHHVVVTGFAAACIWRDLSGAPPFPLSTVAAFVPLSVAYVASDLVATCIPEAREGRYEMLFHHVLGAVVTAATLVAPPFILRFAPYMWLCEVRGSPCAHHASAHAYSRTRPPHRLATWAWACPGWR